MRIQYYLLITLLSVLFVKSVTAAQEEKPAVIQRLLLDSTDVNVRKPTAEKILPFLSDPDFQYDREPQQTNTLLQKLKFWIWDKIFRFFSSNTLRTLWSFLPYLIVAVVLVFVISRLMKVNVSGLFYRTSEKVSLDFKEIDENIGTSTLQDLIEEAVREKKYRRAIRLLYLNVLKSLTIKGHIDWKLDKTNNDYLREINLSNIKQPFAEITRLFEYIWYGEFQLDDDHFLSASSQFQDFNETVLSG